MPNPDDQTSTEELLTFEGIVPDIEIRDEGKREIGVRIMTWGEVGRTEEGLELFERGAFDGTNPSDVILRMEHEGPPIGIGTEIEQRSKDAVGVFRVANTARGDEALTLVRDGMYKGASPMFRRDNHQTTYEQTPNGRLARRKRVDMREVSLTWRPTYQGTGPMFLRSEEVQTVAEDFSPGPETPVPNPAGSTSADQEILEKMRAFADKASGDNSALMERIAILEARTQQETDVQLPNPSLDSAAPRRGDWMQAALTLMDGGDLRSDQKRALADNISDDNPGFIPVVYSNDLIGVIDASRPFIQTTRSIDMPDNGLQISYPRITQRPSVAEQTTEKTEVSSRAITTDRITADVRTFAGAGDISIQLLRRSSPSFLDAFLELLAEQYAIVTEDAAVDALLAASPTAGTGTFDPADPEFGEAFENGVAAGRSLIPDHIWMSTTAMVEFINAKSPSGGGGTPLYPGLAGIAGITGGAGSGPLPMNLTPVWTPALDNETVDVLIGPSSGFRHAEEGTFSLTADVPGRLGRDVALAGFMVFVPVYPAAFTTYVVAT
jgi:phage head maturation protease